MSDFATSPSTAAVPLDVAAGMLAQHPAVAAAHAVGDRLFAQPAAATLPADRATREVAHAAGLAALGAVDWTAVADRVAALDAAAHAAMGATLARAGLFVTAGTAHSVAEVLTALAVAPRHRRVARRWLRELARVGVLTAVGEASYRAERPCADGDLDARLARLGAATAGLGHGEQMGQFLARCARSLPQLLRDEVTVQQLMFPDGRTDTADSTYRENLASRYVNGVAAAALRHVAAWHTRDAPLRVLEIGAGVGGTSAVVIPALADSTVPVDYQFTDVSPFFLNIGREMFGDRPWVRYGRCDVNSDLTAQGYPDGSVDVVLAANVLHNAVDTGALMAALYRLLTPGGWLVFIDTSREHPQIMTSTEFLMSPPAADPDARFTDGRAERDQIFPTVTQWRAAAIAAGFDSIWALPDREHPVAALGQYVHAARTRLRPDPAGLRRYLAGRLPDPPQITVAPGLPDPR
ncbi:class I SAM-dependent methyltransferase [Pilimelia columellifera]|uniref:Methyltransferase type 12 domain-containing protein n=1 Tax=Pilimelia columellifera subsp. columellifera TaxID=706583 RepID=A0ABN3NLI6_9ACTN